MSILIFRTTCSEPQNCFFLPGVYDTVWKQGINWSELFCFPFQTPSPLHIPIKRKEKKGRRGMFRSYWPQFFGNRTVWRWEARSFPSCGPCPPLHTQLPLLVHSATANPLRPSTTLSSFPPPCCFLFLKLFHLCVAGFSWFRSWLDCQGRLDDLN